MSKCASLGVLLSTTIALVAIAAEKQRVWQTGKVLDSKRSRYFAGTIGSHQHDRNRPSARQLRIPSGEHEHFTDCSLQVLREHFDRGRNTRIPGTGNGWSKSANLTVNGPVKFAVEKRKLFCD